MDPAVPLSARFRHIVFPALTNARPKPVDLGAPLVVRPPGAGPGGGVSLTGETASFLDWLFAQAGLCARHYRPETLQRRLPACLRALRARSAGHARQVLERAPALVPAAVSTMLVGVTSFFRDPSVFEMLRTEALPALAVGRTGLHVWSAGCSEGAEVYSVAVLLAEAGLLGGSYVLGTDCRPDAVARARAGVFDPVAVKGVRPDWLGRYFVRRGTSWEVAPALRLAVRWRTADVLRTIEPGIWDVILFRNTAMYLRAEAAASLWGPLEAALRPGGVLVLGKAERPAGVKRLAPWGPCIFRRCRG